MILWYDHSLTYYINMILKFVRTTENILCFNYNFIILINYTSLLKTIKLSLNHFKNTNENLE